MELILSLIGLIIMGAIYVIVFRGKKLTDSQRKKMHKKLKSIARYEHEEKQIFGFDKLLEHIMQLRGYQGSLGSVMKKNAAVFSDIQGLWFAHKIRNKLAHEIDFQLSPRDAKKVITIFQKEIRYIIDL